VGGAFLLLPTDLSRLANSSLATLAFSSNVYFCRTVGYFSPGSDLYPLLHTSSLAVEEQFYLGLPILLLLVHRFCRARLAWALAAVAVVSLGACILLQPYAPLAMVYLSPFRGWELMLGALLVIGAVPAIRQRWQREIVFLLGCGLLSLSVIMTRPGITFPGWQAGIPALGTALRSIRVRQVARSYNPFFACGR
jgi:peptidoglycan/LPS O-acetylase OafA/YrhL